MFTKGRNDTMVTKTEVPSKDRAAAVALLERGGPYTPAEFSALHAGADPLEVLSRKFQTLGPRPSPEEREDRARIETEFGARRAKAEQDLAAAIAATETAKEAMFVAREQLAKLNATTWVSSVGWAPSSYERAGSPGDVEAAEAALDDAERDLKTAGQREADARVKLNAIGVKANEMRRQLGAERAIKK